MSRRRTHWLLTLAALAVGYALLAIPSSEKAPSPPENRTGFAWNQDEHFRALESLFQERRQAGCSADITADVNAPLLRLSELLVQVAETKPLPAAPLWHSVEETLFRAAALAAACPELLPRFVGLSQSLRIQVKDLSVDWPLDAQSTKERLYRLLYGSRTALEQALLQAPPGTVNSLSPGRDEVSATPTATVHGVQLHSGDLLLSRGGAPTSALIARGNDYPGNFSHVALVHIDEDTLEPTAIEAHIESGVSVSNVATYLEDKKLRVLVLRPRATHPKLARDPLLPHRAADAMLRRVQTAHIPYDFAMDFRDDAALFCSEVASAAYAREDFTLWLALSHLSSPVLQSWLAGLGVEHFVTQAPSDLEYDPALRVVAEWRDPEELLKGYIDDAIIDALFDVVSEPAPLPYTAWALPLYRVLKGVSAGLNTIGLVGPIPEGMSATAAARTARFSSLHEELAEVVTQRSAVFKSEQGYPPPYWRLVHFAKEAIGQYQAAP